MNKILIKNACIINEGRMFKGSVLINGDKIAEVFEGAVPATTDNVKVIDAEGKFLLPGAIDDQVHFREPGLTHKGDIASESRWYNDFHGYAEHQAADDHDRRPAMETATGGGNICRQLFFLLRRNER